MNMQELAFSSAALGRFILSLPADDGNLFDAILSLITRTPNALRNAQNDQLNVRNLIRIE